MNTTETTSETAAQPQRWWHRIPPGMYGRLLRWSLIAVIVPLVTVGFSLGTKGSFDPVLKGAPTSAKDSTTVSATGTIVSAFNRSSDLALFTLAIATASLATVWGIKRPCTWQKTVDSLFVLNILLVMVSGGYYVYLSSGGGPQSATFWSWLLSYPVYIAIASIACGGLVEVFALVEEHSK